MVVGCPGAVEDHARTHRRHQEGDGEARRPARREADRHDRQGGRHAHRVAGGRRALRARRGRSSRRASPATSTSRSPAAVADAKKIAALAAKKKVGVFSSSSLRYATELVAYLADEKRGKILGALAFGPAPYFEGKSDVPLNPGLYHYGIHAVEILYTLMGPGCVRVSCLHEKDVDVVTGQWKDGRAGDGARHPRGQGGLRVHGVRRERRQRSATSARARSTASWSSRSSASSRRRRPPWTSASPSR